MALWTEEEIATLRAAISSGVLAVVYDGPPRRQVTYHNLAEMRALLAQMEGTAAAATGQPTRRYVAYSQGFGPTRRGFRRNE